VGREARSGATNSFSISVLLISPSISTGNSQDLAVCDTIGLAFDAILEATPCVKRRCFFSQQS
jgi:hypothetical protein